MAHLTRRVFFILALIVVAIVAWLLGYWTRDLTPVLDITETTISPKVVSPGEDVTISWTVDINRNCPIKIDRSLKDGKGVTYSGSPAFIEIDMLPVQQNGHLRLSSTVPQTAATSVTIDDTLEWWCNPLQWIFPRSMPMPAATAVIVAANAPTVSPAN